MLFHSELFISRSGSHLQLVYFEKRARPWNQFQECIIVLYCIFRPTKHFSIESERMTREDGEFNKLFLQNFISPFFVFQTCDFNKFCSNEATGKLQSSSNSSMAVR